MKRIKVGIPDEVMPAVDQLRGSVPLSAWVRDLVLDKVARHAGAIVPVVVTAPKAAVDAVQAEHDHRHRYVRLDVPVRHVKGQPVYVKRCACGATKEES